MRGRVLYVHPFAEDLNRARRLVSVQSRAPAEIGYGVMTVDLYGCGDSGGDFRDARWDIWHEDVAVAYRWLDRAQHVPISLWGLRLGALLAADFAARSGARVHRLVLWQPILSGRAFIDRFLMARVVSRRIGKADASRETVGEIRDRLRAGEFIEVCGYELASDLVQAIDEVHLEPLGPLLTCPIHWVEVAPLPGAPFPIASEKVVTAWAAQGRLVTSEVAVDANFLVPDRPVDGQRLLDSMRRIYQEPDHAHV